MARRITKEEKEERIKALVAALLAEEEAEGLDAPHETIDDIEDAMIRIGDAVAPGGRRSKIGPAPGTLAALAPVRSAGTRGFI